MTLVESVLRRWIFIIILDLMIILRFAQLLGSDGQNE
ncbi:GSCOCG00004562001-RA-CDS [Cotesia congregata]|nr:GSCOCG00004562001-RA-CDS [Cotesia congregata]